MKEKTTTIFYGANIEELAVVFADIVFRHHVNFLSHYKAFAMDDRKEMAYWDYRLEHEPAVVREKVYSRILDIMQHPEQNKTLMGKRYIFFRDKNVLRITAESSFYERIIDESRVIVPVNVEYVIVVGDFRIDKIWREFEV